MTALDEGFCPSCGAYVTLGEDGIWRDAGDWPCQGMGHHREPIIHAGDEVAR